MNLFGLLAAYGLCFALRQRKAPVVSDFIAGASPDLPDQDWGKVLRDGKSFGARMLYCTFCTGFHCGWLVGIVSISSEVLGDPMAVLQVASHVAWMPCWALACAAFCMVADECVMALGRMGE